MDRGERSLTTMSDNFMNTMEDNCDKSFEHQSLIIADPKKEIQSCGESPHYPRVVSDVRVINGNKIIEYQNVNGTLGCIGGVVCWKNNCKCVVFANYYRFLVNFKYGDVTLYFEFYSYHLVIPKSVLYELFEELGFDEFRIFDSYGKDRHVYRETDIIVINGYGKYMQLNWNRLMHMLNGNMNPLFRPDDDYAWDEYQQRWVQFGYLKIGDDWQEDIKNYNTMPILNGDIWFNVAKKPALHCWDEELGREVKSFSENCSIPLQVKMAEVGMDPTVQIPVLTPVPKHTIYNGSVRAKTEILRPITKKIKIKQQNIRSKQNLAQSLPVTRSNIKTPLLDEEILYDCERYAKKPKIKGEWKEVQPNQGVKILPKVNARTILLPSIKAQPINVLSSVPKHTIHNGSIQAPAQSVVIPREPELVRIVPLVPAKPRDQVKIPIQRQCGEVIPPKRFPIQQNKPRHVLNRLNNKEARKNEGHTLRKPAEVYDKITISELDDIGEFEVLEGKRRKKLKDGELNIENESDARPDSLDKDAYFGVFSRFDYAYTSLNNQVGMLRYIWLYFLKFFIIVRLAVVNLYSLLIMLVLSLLMTVIIFVSGSDQYLLLIPLISFYYIITIAIFWFIYSKDFRIRKFRYHFVDRFKRIGPHFGDDRRDTDKSFDNKENADMYSFSEQVSDYAVLEQQLINTGNWVVITQFIKMIATADNLEFDAELVSQMMNPKNCSLTISPEATLDRIANSTNLGPFISYDRTKLLDNPVLDNATRLVAALILGPRSANRESNIYLEHFQNEATLRQEASPRYSQ